MNRICLDTSAIIAIINGYGSGTNEERLARRWLEEQITQKNSLLIPAPAWGEYLIGLKDQDRRIANKVLQHATVVPFSAECSLMFAEIWELVNGGKQGNSESRQHKVDMQIAATAAALKCDYLCSTDNQMTKWSAGKVTVIKPIPDQPDLLAGLHDAATPAALGHIGTAAAQEQSGGV